MKAYEMAAQKKRFHLEKGLLVQTVRKDLQETGSADKVSGWNTGQGLCEAKLNSVVSKTAKETCKPSTGAPGTKKVKPGKPHRWTDRSPGMELLAPEHMAKQNYLFCIMFQ